MSTLAAKWRSGGAELRRIVGTERPIRHERIALLRSDGGLGDGVACCSSEVKGVPASLLCRALMTPQSHDSSHHERS